MKSGGHHGPFSGRAWAIIHGGHEEESCGNQRHGPNNGKRIFFKTNHPGKNWGVLRGEDLNPWPSGYEPDELPDCSTPHRYSIKRFAEKSNGSNSTIAALGRRESLTSILAVRYDQLIVVFLMLWVKEKEDL